MLAFVPENCRTATGKALEPLVLLSAAVAVRGTCKDLAVAPRTVMQGRRASATMRSCAVLLNNPKSMRSPPSSCICEQAVAPNFLLQETNARRTAA
jgi:hypothetical protein